MTDLELELLKNTLEQLEDEELRSSGFYKISGGFVKAEMFDYDEDYIDIELKSGIISDCENRVYSEQLKIDRKTFEII